MEFIARIRPYLALPLRGGPGDSSPGTFTKISLLCPSCRADRWVYMPIVLGILSFEPWACPTCASVRMEWVPPWWPGSLEYDPGMPEDRWPPWAATPMPRYPTHWITLPLD